MCSVMVEGGELSEGHARALLGVADHGAAPQAARLVVSQGLTVRQTEALVRKLREAPMAAAPAARPDSAARRPQRRALRPA